MGTGKLLVLLFKGIYDLYNLSALQKIFSFMTLMFKLEILTGYQCVING